MTKGEWRIEGPNRNYGQKKYTVYTGTEREPKWFLDLDFLTEEPSGKTKALTAGIISAVNNTYGKGINPEAVEKMYETLKLVETELSKSTSRATVFALTCLIQEALTTAKL